MLKRLILFFALLFVVALITIPRFMKTDNSRSNIIKISPDKDNGFYHSYLLYIPNNIKNRHLLVIPNNTGTVDDKIKIHEERAYSLIEWRKEYADKLGSPLLVPIFPRPEKIGHIYTHALDRDCLITDIEDIKRLDLQLISMIDNAINRLKSKDIILEDKVIMAGFSALGMFVNRFAILHPERVRTTAIGSPGGWAIAPIEEYKGEKLIYPIGIGDVEELTGEKIDIQEFKKIPQFFYIGDQDTNDASETCFYRGAKK